MGLDPDAATRAVELIEPGMKLGLGSGSTARLVIEALAARRRRGELQDIVGVPTSTSSRELAARLQIPLATLDEEPRLDLTIDGADEVDPELGLIKGLGGALLWEKIVASVTDRFVIVVDDGKLVDRLGSRSPLPVEVVPFGWQVQLPRLTELGAVPTLRLNHEGSPYVTDGNHYILDCGFAGGMEDPSGVEAALQAAPGVVETGLFLGMAETVVVAAPEGTRLLRRGGA
ncbi:MAG: ribose 5-phosphate isomerase A [Gemmatimonadota bacterium]